MDDNELMLLVRNGDQEAYETLIKRYMTQAKALACGYIHDSYAAEDIVQDSFADLYVQRFSFDQRYPFSAYLYAIIKNKSMNYLRKNRELPMSSFDEETELSLLEQKLVSDMTPESEYFKRTDFEELMSAIEGLKADERNLLYLYAAEEYTYKEIAGRLGMTVMQVKIKLFRARKKLRKGAAGDG